MKRTDKSALEQKISRLAPIAELMPSVVIVQNLEPFTSLYMSNRGLKELGISQEELIKMGPDYLKEFFILEDSMEYLQKLRILLFENDITKTFTFFQQVRFVNREELVWHIGSTRIFHKDDKGKASHIITIAIPIDRMEHLKNKAERLQKERHFYHKNLKKFLTLGKKEREILKLVALGKSSPEIANTLFISFKTVQTHRKIIKQKLSINSTYDFTWYAQVFDLI